jgi:hypothetical protein
MKSRSAILEGASQVHARAVPWGLAQGRLYSIQSRYVLVHHNIIAMTQDCFAGARACVGRRCELSLCRLLSFSHNTFRFFETEAVAVMTMLVSRYKIEVKEEPEFAGETFQERYARITAFDQGLTTT